ncbi:hypothetical protein H5P33_28520 [Mycolicibacterium arabiense]|uniref:hypothetical protein n=1 Tax=Mycolicibacterium arabiense TaxID=1286181 RepID=UPI0013D852AB|nr:hypothetical protein [Mycolicibacterium arabiense]MCV7376663.1 hypothetical protein [Mycolicibacterium arabiense]
MAREPVVLAQRVVVGELLVVAPEPVVRVRPVVAREPVVLAQRVPAGLVAELLAVAPELVAEPPVVAPEQVVERVPVVAEPLVVVAEQPVVVQAAVRLVPAEAAVPVVSVAPMRPHCRPLRVSPVATRAPRHLWVRLMPAPVSSAMAAVRELVVERVAVAAQAVARVPEAAVLMWDNSSMPPVQAPRSTLRRA